MAFQTRSTLFTQRILCLAGMTPYVTQWTRGQNFHAVTITVPILSLALSTEGRNPSPPSVPTATMYTEHLTKRYRVWSMKIL